jgi:DNA helicase-2/ATP-dependent DNA helicase PcrA|tara:strand:- start:15194 stop:16240 length:1047 start_codon:yes stop_codon:yes gene_type:complete
MDKRVIFAVAGAGKTSTIIDSINEDSRCLIVTYTDNNTEQLKNRIISKFGGIPSRVRVYSYFTFLYSFCYRPICGYKVKTKGINFDYPLPASARFAKKDKLEHYLDSNRRLFANRIAKLLVDFDVIPEVTERIEQFFDHVFIDEVQDFAGNDFNFLCELGKLNTNVLLVGDFYQHTFKTSIDQNIQKNLHNSFDEYCAKLKKSGFTIDLDSLSHSYRCSPSVCSFVEDNLGIKIGSHKDNEVQVRRLDCPDEIAEVYLDDSVIKLFFQTSNTYTGNVENWGKTKGLDHYNDVCVALNPTSYKAFMQGKLSSLAPLTRNKLYVACTRANGNLYFVEQKMLIQFKKQVRI